MCKCFLRFAAARQAADVECRRLTEPHSIVTRLGPWALSSFPGRNGCDVR